MPFGKYTDFAHCVLMNKDKNDPQAYCSQIHKDITGQWPSEKETLKMESLNMEKLVSKIETLYEKVTLLEGKERITESDFESLVMKKVANAVNRGNIDVAKAKVFIKILNDSNVISGKDFQTAKKMLFK